MYPHETLETPFDATVDDVVVVDDIATGPVVVDILAVVVVVVVVVDILAVVAQPKTIFPPRPFPLLRK